MRHQRPLSSMETPLVTLRGHREIMRPSKRFCCEGCLNHDTWVSIFPFFPNYSNEIFAFRFIYRKMSLGDLEAQWGVSSTMVDLSPSVWHQRTQSYSKAPEEHKGSLLGSRYGPRKHQAVMLLLAAFNSMHVQLWCCEQENRCEVIGDFKATVFFF